MACTEEEIKRLKRLRQSLEEDRDDYHGSEWKLVAQLVLTELSSDSDAQRKLLSSKAQQYTSIATNALQGWAYGRSISWMHLRLEDEHLAGQGEDSRTRSLWLQACERILMEDLGRSSFYDEAQSFTDVVFNLSTAIMLMDWDEETQTMIFENINPMRCAIQQDRMHNVDVLFYEFELTRSQAEDAFGADKLPEKISSSKDEGRKWTFVKGYLPASRYTLSIPGEDPWYEVIWTEEGRSTVVSERRLGWKPFVCWRFQRSLTGSAWGTGSPGERCLPEIIGINAMEKTKLKGMQLRNDPPVDVTEGLEIEIAPAAINYIGTNESWAYRQLAGSAEEISTEIMRKEQTLREAYYVDFFLVLQQTLEQKKTATEASLLVDEKSQIMSSFSSRLHREFLEVVLETLWEMEVAHGRLPEAPPSMQDATIRIDFVSPLAIAQRKAQIYAPARQFMAETLSFAQVDPSVRYLFKVPEYAELMSRELMIDQRFVRSQDEIDELMARDRQLAEREMMADQDAQRLKAEAASYSALSRAPEKGSPAEAQMMGQGGV